MLLLAALALPAATQALAQQMLVHQGSVTTAVPLAEAGQMAYTAGGTQLAIAGRTFDTASIDSITTTREAYADSLVSVRYEANGAHVTITNDVAPLITVTVTGGKVSCLADPSLQSEVTYVLSGTNDAGGFFMDGEFKARLRLNNLKLTSTAGAAIDIANGKRIAVEIPTGTSSSVCDAPLGSHKAAFFVNGHPEFEGGGSLKVTGLTKHAFASDEYCYFKENFGTLTVSRAVGDGLHVEQYLKIDGGAFNIKGTAGDCIDVSPTKDATDEFNGQAFINGGRLDLAVTAADVKGLKAENDITINGGVISATVSGNGTKGISTNGSLIVTQGTAEATNAQTRIEMTVTGKTFMPGDDVSESKCRGVKADGDFHFKGGTIAISTVAGDNKAIAVDGYFYKYKSGGGVLEGDTAVDAKKGTVEMP